MSLWTFFTFLLISFFDSNTNIGVAYGDGVYFARNSSYSLQYSQLHGKMYVAKVLVGRYTTGERGMKAPPSRDEPGNPGVRYDSVVDNVRNPSIFVIFVDNHCCWCKSVYCILIVVLFLLN